MRKAQKFQPNIKDVSEVTAKLQKRGHSDLIHIFLGQNATLTKGGRVSTKKGVNDSFDPRRTAYRKGFSIDDFINELVGLGTSGAQAALFTVDQALQANIEKHKAKELKPKFKPKDDRKHIADRLRKNSQSMLNSKILAADPETKEQIIEAMRDAGLKVSDDGKVSIPRNLSEEQLRKIEKEEIVPKPKLFKERYGRDYVDDLISDYYSYSTAHPTEEAFANNGDMWKKMSHIGYLLKNKGYGAAVEAMLEVRENLALMKGSKKSDLDQDQDLDEEENKESVLYERF